MFQCTIFDIKTNTIIVALAIATYLWYSFWFWDTVSIKPKNLFSSYDYIIIGGGSAGCVMAARLSEKLSKSVLLIESGGEEGVGMYVPRIASFMANSRFDWKFETTEQKGCCEGAPGGKVRIPRGRILGGTNNLNFMIYTRGHPSDYDDWAKMGNEGWSYDEVLPYFKKSEYINVPRLKKSSIHGSQGLMATTEASPTILGNLSFEAAQAAGYRYLDEMTGTESGGLGLPLFTARDGLRHSSSSRFLRPIAALRKNLHILTSAHVTKILIDNTTLPRRAVGVEILYNNDRKLIVKTTGEVILSAGAVSSPQILMLSGLGPEDHLRDLKVPLVMDLPAVGQNLEDHTRNSLVYILNSSMDGTPLKSLMDKIYMLVKGAYDYMIDRKGLLSEPTTESMGFFRTGLTPNSQKQDIQINFFASDETYPLLPLLDEFQLRTADQKASHTLELIKHYLFKQPPAVVGTIIQLNVKARGFIKLRSNDPLDPPIIDPRYGSVEEDIEVHAQGLRIFTNIMQSKPFHKFAPKLLPSSIVGCVDGESDEPLSDDQLRCLARKRLTTNFHQMGTCRMGNDPKNSVVDRFLKVHGISGLRVVDASIFPGPVSGNLNAPVIMVAEKAADMILNGS